VRACVVCVCVCVCVCVLERKTHTLSQREREEREREREREREKRWKHLQRERLARLVAHVTSDEALRIFTLQIYVIPHVQNI
jgi:hypothetical protein